MRIALAGVLASLWLAPAASASLVRVDSVSTEGDEMLVFEAAPGERNNVSVSVRDNTDIRVTDTGGTLRAAGDVCVPDGDAVTCAAESLAAADIALGDGDDRLTVSWEPGAPPGVVLPRCEGFIELRDGPGNDTVFGSRVSEHFVNGAGDDSLRGGGGDDQFDGGRGSDTFFGGSGRDRACYDGRSSDLSVDLDGRADDGAAGERDRVGRDLENITGGSGDDRLVGDAGRNELIGGGGGDRLRGGRGRDTLRGESGRDRLFGGPGRDVFVGGPGKDLIR